MTFSRKLIIAFAVALPATISLVSAGETDRISVSGTGTTTVAPDTAEISATVNGSATVASDSLKKFRDNRRRGVDAIEKLKLLNLAIVSGGRSMQPDSQARRQLFGDGENQTQPNAFIISETLSLKLSSIDAMKPEELIERIVKVCDVAKDAGMSITSIHFRSSKAEAAQATALKLAFASARDKAEKMAAHTHCRVRRVAAARESAIAAAAAATSQAMSQSMMYAIMSEYGGGTAEQLGIGLSTELKPISVSTSVEVDFITEPLP